MKILKLALITLFIAPSAFAASLTTLDIGRETSLQECGGSIEANISENGRNNQVNLVLRNVRFCSNFIVHTTGKEYKIPGQDGNRTGSFTISANDIEIGSSLIKLTVRSGSGKHADKIFVPVRRVVVNPPAPNCFADICVGQRVINVDRDYAYATVLAIDSAGKFILRFDSGILAGQIGGNWNRNDLAKTAGCSGDLCVGNTVIVISREFAFAQVAGLQTNGRYVLKFLTGEVAGKTGGNWTSSDMVLFAR